MPLYHRPDEEWVAFLIRIFALKKQALEKLEFLFDEGAVIDTTYCYLRLSMAKPQKS